VKWALVGEAALNGDVGERQGRLAQELTRPCRRVAPAAIDVGLATLMAKGPGEMTRRQAAFPRDSGSAARRHRAFTDRLLRDPKLTGRQAASMPSERPRLGNVLGQKVGLNRHGHVIKEQTAGLVRIVERGQQASAQMSDNGIGETPAQRDAEIGAGPRLLDRRFRSVRAEESTYRENQWVL